MANKYKKPYHCYRESKNILTLEDWYPTIDNKVRVNLSLGDQRSCVTVYGGDDFGMEAFFDNGEQARELYNKIVDLTLIEELEALGMKRV